MEYKLKIVNEAVQIKLNTESLRCKSILKKNPFGFELAQCSSFMASTPMSMEGFSSPEFQMGGVSIMDLIKVF